MSALREGGKPQAFLERGTGMKTLSSLDDILLIKFESRCGLFSLIAWP